jgi:5-methylcytosine-specific restriction protein A
MALWVKDPRCQVCHRVVAPHAMIRDHIIPLAEGGQDNETNEQILCFDCSRTKTAEESRRGCARTRSEQQ